MDRIRRFMAGRLGADRLFRFLLAAALILFILSYILPGGLLLRGLALALAGWGLFRALSRDLAARGRENALYLETKERFLRWCALLKCRWQDRKTHSFFPCPKCGKTLRVPKNRGRVVVTCPVCGWQFERRT